MCAASTWTTHVLSQDALCIYANWLVTSSWTVSIYITGIVVWAVIPTSNVGLPLVQRFRRCAIFDPALRQCLVVAGIVSISAVN